jgi:phenylacetate-CoA ligase
MAPALSDRELWNPEVQALDSAEVDRRAREGFAREWQRVWDVPIPFHRERYEAAGLGPGEVPPLDEVPRTIKQDLRDDERAHPPFGTHRAIGLDQARRLAASSGTTGSPTFIFYGPRDLEVHLEVSVRNLWRYGVRPGDRFTHPWPQGLYPTGVTAGRQYLELGVLEIPVGPPFSREVAIEHLRLWEILRPNAFLLSGHQILTYEDAAAEAGLDFRALLAGANVGFIEAACQFEGPRRRVEEHYGFRLHNMGGASDVPGFGTSDCRFHTGLHAPGDHMVIQVCDPVTGRELPAGERGSLVVTAFGLDAVVIRFDVEDVVVAHQSLCPCGESGPRYTLLGRAADLAMVEGRSLLPLDVQLALDDQGAPEFQMVRVAPGAPLRVRVETEGRASVLAALLKERLEVPVDVEAVVPGALPRSTFKPRRIA